MKGHSWARLRWGPHAGMRSLVSPPRPVHRSDSGSGGVDERANSLDLGDVVPEQVAQFGAHASSSTWKLTTAFKGSRREDTAHGVVRESGEHGGRRRRPQRRRPDGGHRPAAPSRPSVACSQASCSRSSVAPGADSDDLGAGGEHAGLARVSEAIAAQRQVMPATGPSGAAVHGLGAGGLEQLVEGVDDAAAEHVGSGKASRSA
jgi:hypothetical protein